MRSSGEAGELRRPERELRKFRARELASSKFGSVLHDLIEENAARGGKVLAEDDRAFAAAVRALQPLHHDVSYVELLDKPIDAETIERLTDLTKHIARRDAALGKRLKTVMGSLSQLEGSTLGQVLQAGAEDAKKQRQPAARARRKR